ncbi:pentapeptide repeat-containing protein [Saccharothrix saharensis]|uniref:pentapeptide repeat-containing protein n=1 Tax=Saccharothrix saharensis TaxID=571190 RepID=UPI003678BFE8
MTDPAQLQRNHAAHPQSASAGGTSRTPLSRWTVPVVVAVVLAAAVVVLVVLWRWIDGLALADPASKDKAAAQLDAVKIAASLVVSGGGVFALYLATRRQRTQELELQVRQAELAQRDRVQAHAEQVAETNRVHAEHVAADTRLHAEAQRITELYTKASEQLGSDKAPVRLAGLYALERLAQDNPAQRQTIVNVLCAYLRMPYTVPDDRPVDDVEEPMIAAHRERMQERQVRLTAQTILAAHMRPGPDGHNPDVGFWPGLDIDLTGATLVDFDLTGCRLGNIRFAHAIFVGHAGFDEAEFTRLTTFKKALFSGSAGFRGARFADDVGFDDATFGGVAMFDGANFDESAEFSRVRFGSSAVFGEVHFNADAVFRAARFGGNAVFKRARVAGRAVFSGAHFLAHARYSEVSLGRAEFDGVSFSGRAEFDRARMAGFAVFEKAEFAGVAVFVEAHFAEAAIFSKADFAGDAVFRLACFAGNVVFRETAFVSIAAMSQAKGRVGIRQDVWPLGWTMDTTDRIADDLSTRWRRVVPVPAVPDVLERSV